MNRGVNHQTIFFSDSDRLEFGARLDDIHEKFACEVHAYCLMDNHFHLLLHCPQGGLSAAMQRLSSLFTRHVNDRVARDGPLFRGRFHSRAIVEPGYLLTACRYIHRNPVDLGVAIDDYRWSSHRTYLGHRRTPRWLNTSTVLNLFDDDRAAFDRFVLGSLRDRGQATFDRPEAVARLDDAIRLIIAELGVRSDETRSLARSGALAVAAGLEVHDRQAFAEFYDVETPGALRVACSRAHHRFTQNRWLREAVERAVELVGSPPTLHGVTSGV
jgi:REP element-mobilizing transposase RayT